VSGEEDLARAKVEAFKGGYLAGRQRAFQEVRQFAKDLLATGERYADPRLAQVIIQYADDAFRQSFDGGTVGPEGT
jgi:hypothetical protein